MRYKNSVEATKYALRILQTHCHEGTFEVWFPSPEECDTMKDRFVRLGCAANEDRYKQIVEVTCPPDLDLDKLEQKLQTDE